MVKKKRSNETVVEQLNTLPQPKFYAHYDVASNQILSINNHRDAEYTHAVEITFEQYDNLVSGKERFFDYYIGTVINLDGIPVQSLISKKINAAQNFKIGELVWLSEGGCEDITVHWDEYNNKWIFVITDELRQMFYDNKLLSTGISFFIVLNKDPNFLLRTISIGFQKLCADKVEIPFETLHEKTIESVGIASDVTGLRCGLQLWRIHE